MADGRSDRTGGGPAEPAEPGDLGPETYAELRAIAAAHLRRERPDHTLQPTALVNEAWLRVRRVLARGGDPAGERLRFAAIASRAIRALLVDHARRRRAARRGGNWKRVTLDLSACDSERQPLDLLELEEALQGLAALDQRQARVVELRFFGGLSVAETAQVLGVSERSVEGDWSMARAFLRRSLEGGDGT